MRLMTFMFNITSSMADFLYNLFNTGLILGALLVLGSTIGTVWTGSVKEAYSNERVAANEAQTAQANEAAARANERAARLEDETAKTNREAARLAQEAEQTKAQLAWRSLRPDAFQALINMLSQGSGSVTLAYTANDPEALAFAVQISNAFAQARPAPPLPELWRIEPQPRIDTRTIYYGVSVPGPENAAVLNIRAAFNAAHISYSTDPVPPPHFEAAGMVVNGVPPDTDALILIGSKRPPF